MLQMCIAAPAVDVLQAAEGATDAVIELSVDPSAKQELKAWGITPSPLDWDGRHMLQDHAMLVRMYKELGVTAVRLPIGAANIFDASTQKIRSSSIDWIIVPQVKALVDAGIATYVLSIVSPPTSMKRYNTKDPVVDQNSNHLRIDSEDQFVEYLGDMVSLIRDRQVLLPAAVSIQYQPDVPGADFAVPPALVQGGGLTPEQWLRVAEKVRQEFDSRGLDTVAVIGPESFGRTWLGEVVRRDTRTDFLGGVAFNSRGIGRTATGLIEAETTLPDVLSVERDVWMLAANPVLADNDQDLLVRCAFELCVELGEQRVTCWFWRYGFSWEASPETLTWGDIERRAPVFGFLQTLWSDAKPGARVYGVECRGPSLLVSGVRAVAFVDERRHVVLVANGTMQALRLELVAPVGWKGARSVVEFASTGRIEKPLPDAAHWPVDLPANSVAIIRAERR